MSAPIVRIVADASGHSRFVDDAEPLASDAPSLSAPHQASSVRFLAAPAGWDLPSHPAPRVQWMVTLRGTVEVRTTDGAVRRFNAGDVVRLEDTTGLGHATRVVSGADWLALVVVD
jgi:hypothetical protein